jgi:hypothetical protein
MRRAVSDIMRGGSVWAPQFYTEVEEGLLVEFPCQGMVGRYGTTDWFLPVRHVLDLIVAEMRRSGHPRAEWLDCLANSFYGNLDLEETYSRTKGMADDDFRDFLKFLVDERDSIFEAVRRGEYIAGEWGTDLHEAPPTTIDFVFPCRMLVKSDEDLWTFSARWVLKLVEADLFRRNDPDAENFRDHVAYFYPELQPAFWSTIGALPS